MLASAKENQTTLDLTLNANYPELSIKQTPTISFYAKCTIIVWSILDFKYSKCSSMYVLKYLDKQILPFIAICIRNVYSIITIYSIIRIYS